jgi:AcrR family transcriptional regulator
MRAAKKTDQRKNEQILAALADVLAEDGGDTTVEAVAKKASVSKQTIYNYYGGKEELLRAYFAAMRASIAGPLSRERSGENFEARLAEYFLGVIEGYVNEKMSRASRGALALACHYPDLLEDVLSRRPDTVRGALAAFLEREAEGADLCIPDPHEAADVALGMVTNALVYHAMLGRPVDLSGDRAEARARTCARLFVRAYRKEPQNGPH